MSSHCHCGKKSSEMIEAISIAVAELKNNDISCIFYHRNYNHFDNEFQYGISTLNNIV